MIPFMYTNEKLKDVEKSLNSQLWHACAGGMVQLPPLNSKVFYFPQGHEEHSNGTIDFRTFPQIPPLILCRVLTIKFMADPETDEVYAKLRLLPLPGKDFNTLEEDRPPEEQEKPVSFAKTLTQSDANNGGGFSVPRYCAETIFPRLDLSADPPVQTIHAKDVHNQTWKFRHIYRGTPRRHLLTTGWSTFVNQKKLVAGDSIVFLRSENGDLCVGIRRSKRGIEGNQSARNATEKVTLSDVVEAAKLAGSGHVFEVVYYPRGSTPEFCVRARVVSSSLQIRWWSGMRFKMAFETEDSSRISWFIGTVSSVQVVDRNHWPESPWRLLQVTWDEPDLLQNVNRVSPWLVELVSNMPTIPLPPYLSPRKKPRFPIESHFLSPTISTNILGRFDNPPAGMQGARHAHYGFSTLSLPERQLTTREPNSGPFLQGHLNRHQLTRSSSGSIIPTRNDSVTCFLTLNSSGQPEKSELVLFGKKISPEQRNLTRSSEAKTGHCKVFLESEDVGRTLDLTLLSSYEELCRTLSDMFGIESLETLNRVRYRDCYGVWKNVGEEAFSEFMKRARRVMIPSESSSGERY